MGNITYVDILKLLAFIVLLIMPPWFALVRQFEKGIHKSLIVLMTLGYTFLAILGLISYTYTQTLLPFLTVLITIFLIKKRKVRGELEYYLRNLKGRRWKVAGLSLALKVATFVITIYFVTELQKYGFDIKEQEISNELVNAGWGEFILLSIIAGVFAPILEEFVFRHLFYRNFSKRIGPIFSAVITSLMFSGLHFNLASSAATFSVGIFNCYLYEKEGYGAAVLSHSIFNVSSLFLVFLLKVLNINVG